MNANEENTEDVAFVELGLSFRRLGHVMAGGFLAAIVTGLVVVATMPIMDMSGDYFNPSFPFLFTFTGLSVMVYIFTRRMLKSMNRLAVKEERSGLKDFSRVHSRTSLMNLIVTFAVSALLVVYYVLDYNGNVTAISEVDPGIYSPMLVFPILTGIAAAFTLLTTYYDYKTWRELEAYLDSRVPPELSFLKETGMHNALKSQKVGFALGLVLAPSTIFGLTTVTMILNRIAGGATDTLLEGAVTSGMMVMLSLLGAALILFLSTSLNFMKGMYRIGTCFQKIGTGDLQHEKGKRSKGKAIEKATPSLEKRITKIEQQLEVIMGRLDDLEGKGKS
ncbi:MAG: hypothetical protein ACFFCS_03705 [Candidatus Hodarchaeota archaeon]